jgi:hypothetical protein
MVRPPEQADTIEDRSTLELRDVLAEISKSIMWCGKMRDGPQGHTLDRLEYVKLQATLIDSYLRILRQTEMETEIRSLQALSAHMRAQADGNEV